MKIIKKFINNHRDLEITGDGHIVDTASPTGGVITDYFGSPTYIECPGDRIDVNGVKTAIQHMNSGGIGVWGCDCGSPNCTGYQNFFQPLEGRGIVLVHPG